MGRGERTTTTDPLQVSSLPGVQFPRPQPAQEHQVVKIIGKYVEPKLGHEKEYVQALFDRHDASMEMLSLGLLGQFFQRKRYRQLITKWENAIDRMKAHGQDRIDNYDQR